MKTTLTPRSIDLAPSNGFGYAAHTLRTPANDKAVCAAATQAGLTIAQFEAFVDSKLGRWLGDEYSYDLTAEQKVAKAAKYIAKFLQA